jgi:hypothetical protein
VLKRVAGPETRGPLFLSIFLKDGEHLLYRDTCVRLEVQILNYNLNRLIGDLKHETSGERVSATSYAVRISYSPGPNRRGQGVCE